MHQYLTDSIRIYREIVKVTCDRFKYHEMKQHCVSCAIFIVANYFPKILHV